ncbi:TerB family tellurite resistance protein [Colwellia sp. KU-HH00111]|uniref:tellurite resistance TerB family protein n=1 Tax=Colwellia sp. KU-HH00111 TaxID=3127652 RepID=UPI0033657E71
MLNKITTFFNDLLAVNQSDTPCTISVEIACAVLLCEVMRADNIFTEQEQEELSAILVKHFTLSSIEVETVLEQAFELSENASDFYQFTSKLNQQLSLDQRIEIVSLLWQVAYADGELANIEEHIIRKIADLLHLRHNEYIATKISAQQFYASASD